MKLFKLSLLLLILIACRDSMSQVVLAQESKPNILVIFGDDVGWMNVSSYGSDIMGVKTPNIDRIGQEGLCLSSYYVQIGKTLEGTSRRC